MAGKSDLRLVFGYLQIERSADCWQQMMVPEERSAVLGCQNESQDHLVHCIGVAAGAAHRSHFFGLSVVEEKAALKPLVPSVQR